MRKIMQTQARLAALYRAMKKEIADYLAKLRPIHPGLAPIRVIGRANPARRRPVRIRRF